MESLQLKNYFLGKLSPSETEEVELVIISQSEIEWQIHQAEENLIEDYLENSLTAEEVKDFQNNYLITDERRIKVELLRDLKSFAQKADRNSLIKENKPDFFERLKASFGLRSVWLTFAAAVLIFLIGFVWLWNSQSSLDKEIAALNSQDLSNLENFGKFKIMNLVGGNTRSVGNGNSIAENDVIDGILLRLSLPNGDSSTQNYTVRVLKDGQVLHTFTQNSLSNQEVRLILPKELLKKGEYQIRLEKNSEKYNYNFIIR